MSRYIVVMMVLAQVCGLGACGKAVGMSKRDIAANKAQSLSVAELEQDRLNAERIASENGWIIRRSDGWTTVQLRAIEAGQPSYYITHGNRGVATQKAPHLDLLIKLSHYSVLQQKTAENGKVFVRTGRQSLDAILDRHDVALVRPYYLIQPTPKKGHELLQWLVLTIKDGQSKDTLINTLKADASVIHISILNEK